MTLARQMMPGNSDYFMQVYEDATREPHSNLIVDLTHHCPEDKRLRSIKFVKQNNPQLTIYSPK